MVSLYSGVARLSGLPHVFIHEVLADKDNNAVALVIGFDETYVDALFFDESFDCEQFVYGTGKAFSISVAETIVGRVINGLGQPEDGLGPIAGREMPIFVSAPPIIDRQPVTTPLETGIKIIDTNLPLGRGQRELIIGDRKLGKTTIAVDAVLNQKHAPSPIQCVYAVCGQTGEALRDLIALFEKENAFLYTVVVAAPASASFAAQYLAPFVGCTIGEYFRDAGHDALVVYDDLSKHANAYRNISLLLERTPNREAYPGDIFSLHAGLLERAAQLSDEKGGGSLSALPIIETQEGDIASFVPTNLISITDGQIYLERGLFQKRFIPAVNVGLSVSRVGSQAQPPVLKQVVGGIRLALSQYKELQKLSQLETTVSGEAQKKIHRGDLILELLKQDKHESISWPHQVVLFHMVEEGFFDDLPKASWHRFESLLREMLTTQYAHVLDRIRNNTFGAEEKKIIDAIVVDAKHEFLSPAS